ncbi:MAG: hypothetical protein QG553_433 [Patescibacteria group bacterium]|nr:hypothetical protein [Patescibacteria group bacterium]
MIFQKLLKSLNESKTIDRRAEQYRDLIRREAKIGGKLFGPIPSGHRREFFCLDEHTWVWYEEWVDGSNQKQSKTTRYDVRPNGVIKVQDGHQSQYVGLDEARNLYQAVELYNQRIDAEYDLS